MKEYYIKIIFFYFFLDFKMKNFKKKTKLFHFFIQEFCKKKKKVVVTIKVLFVF